MITGGAPRYRRDDIAGCWRDRSADAVYQLVRVMYQALDSSPAHRLLGVQMVERVHRRMTAPRARYADVVEIVGALRAAGVTVWLIGGWGCDALLGEETRPHADLDLVLPKTQAQRAMVALEELGFVVYARFEMRVLNVVVELIDRRRRKVALHLPDIEPGKADGWEASLTKAMQAIGFDSLDVFATGRVNGLELPCVSTAVQLLLHTGYEPDDVDRCDVSLLCSRFSLPLPPGYGPGAARAGE